jgi:hypothetical protein
MDVDVGLRTPGTDQSDERLEFRKSYRSRSDWQSPVRSRLESVGEHWDAVGRLVFSRPSFAALV